MHTCIVGLLVRAGGGWMLVTKIRDSRELEDCLEGTWRPFEEWGGGGGGTAPSKASGQAPRSLTHTQRAAGSEQHQASTHQASSGRGRLTDCCRVRLAPRSSDRGGRARYPQVTPGLATHRQSCPPESSTPDLSSSVHVDAPHLACLPSHHPPVLQPHQPPPNPAGLAGPFPSHESCEDRQYLR